MKSIHATIAAILLSISFVHCSASFAAASALASPSPARVTANIATTSPGAQISGDFNGLSFEVAMLFPSPDGIRYFRSDNKPLIQLYQTLGIKSLRIGGNSSDRNFRHAPSDADLDSLFAFARAAGMKVIYCLRLHDGDPAEAARTAKYIMDRYADCVDSFSIGQEPSAYPVIEKTPDGQTTKSKAGMGAGFEKYPYETYAAEWKKFAAAIIAAVPNVRFCGPSVHNKGEWATDFIRDFASKPANHVTLITEHLYPGGAGGKIPTPEIGRDRMLAPASVSDSLLATCEKLHASFVPVAEKAGLPYRLEEVNNYFNGGAANVSNTYASALWGLDFMWWWAAHGAAGLNFHGGDRVNPGPNTTPSRYTAYFTLPGGHGYEIRPLGYAFKAFALGSGGKLLPVTLANPDNANIAIYSTLSASGELLVTIINKEHGAAARPAEVTLALDKPRDFATARAVTLASPPDNDIAATTATLGGAAIQPDGTWSGEWTPLNNFPVVTIPPSTALILRCAK